MHWLTTGNVKKFGYHNDGEPISSVKRFAITELKVCLTSDLKVRSPLF
ncbi:hypothetical protein VCHE40_0460 [Vibrio cholerae HE-40]|nr:hypothetical protein VCHE39_0804 [Vibrio cholerae HE39]EGR09136.1 hypothetical protein VCHE48_1500 [Vibrio cholerae HE48]EJH65647.1 hypothetical protein VCHE45_0588 [Vibrio cholerae HE-45]EKL33066.1 hypothetical protein VCHE40_0460 [Vibrio cholerae HE-40]EKL36979.1 hypothetical protein VCHE46_0464 [Vibrio cholerae HE-46]